LHKKYLIIITTLILTITALAIIIPTASAVFQENLDVPLSHYAYVTSLSWSMTESATSGGIAITVQDPSGNTIETVNVPVNEYQSEYSGTVSINGYYEAGSFHVIFASVNYITEFDASLTYTNYYYLTVSTAYSTAGGWGYYESGHNGIVGLSAGDVSTGTGGKVLFTQWTVGGSSYGTVYSQSNGVYMDTDKTITANWQQYYYLTVTSTYGTPSGTDWYTSGTTAYASLNTGTVAGSTGTQYVFSGWGTDASGSNYAQSVGITMNAAKTATASWTTQYYLTVNNGGYSTQTGSGWYNSGSSATAGVAASTVSGGTGIRYVFASWTGDASGTTYSASNAITMSAPKTATATWTQQLYLTVSTAHSTTTGEGWYNYGATAHAGVAAGTVAGTTGIQYLFTTWNVGGSNYASSDNIVMTNPVTATAGWKTQYYLTVSTTRSSQTGQGWYDSGNYAYAGVLAGTVAGTTGTQYIFASWTGDASGTTYSQSAVITMNAPKTATASWTTQYYLTITTARGSSTGAGWYNSGATAYAGITSNPIAGTTGIRYSFTTWGTNASGSTYSQSNAITMSAPKTATANWQTQYYLTIASTYGNPSGQNWYNAGATATFAVTTPISGGTGINNIFNSWTGSGTGSYTGSTASQSVTMNNPITETASWTTQYYLTVTSTYGTPSGAGWYNSGATAYAGLDIGTSGSNVFDHWTNDASGTTYSQSAPITMNAPKTALASWGILSSYYITASSSSGGSLTPNGTVTVLDGNDQSFTIAADVDYELSELYIDYAQTAISSNVSFTFYNVIANHSIYIVFQQVYNETIGTGNLAIGQFSAPPVATSGNAFTISAMANTVTDYNTLKNVSIALSQSILLTWNNLDVFNATNLNGYLTFVSGQSTPLNATAVRLSWTITMASQFTTGSINVIAADVYDLTDNTTSTSQNDLFTFLSLGTNTGGGGGGGGGGGKPQNNTIIIQQPATPKPTENPTETPAALTGILLIVAILALVVVIGITRSKTAKQMWKERNSGSIM